MLKQMNMASSNPFSLFFILLMFLSYHNLTITASDKITTTNIGAIIDVDSRAGKEQETAMKVAVQKFNTNSISHKLAIHFLNSSSDGDPLQAASAAEELIKAKQVEVLIVGTDKWEETALVANIGKHAKIPVISFSAADNDIMPSLAQLQWPFLVQMVASVSDEISCIAAMVHSYNWRRVIVVNEDNAYGGQSRNLIPLSDALHNVGSEIEHRLVLPRLPSLFDAKEILHEEVAKLLEKQSRVFIVLESSLPMVTELVKEAKRIGLMGTDSVWILTNGVSSLLDSVNSSVFISMQGALGIKTYYSEESRAFLDFKAHFRETFRLDHPEEDRLDLGIHALRAYDCVTAISQSVSSSKTGVLNGILSSNFSGLSGQIWFKNGRLSDSPKFGIINIVGKSYKELGFWSSKYGFVDNIDEAKGDQSMKELTAMVNWPGDLKRDPKGWAMPTITNKLKIGVPGNTSFEKFVKVTRNESSNEIQVTGFCIDVFKAVINVLEAEQGYTFSCEFVPFPGSYDELVNRVYDKTYDAVIGDVTILAERTKYVEFTQPYTESGLSMVVPVKSEPYKAWKFMRPFTNEMWFASFGILFYTMFVIWFMEHQTNEQFRGPWKDQLVTALWFTFSSLFFAHKEKIQSNYSKVVVMMWLFVVFILTSSYTASLTSMLTVRKLEPTVPSIEWLLRTNSTVGCDPDSFVGKYLKEVLHLENIKYIHTQKEYPEKFKSGEIKAAFLELPYLKVFLNEYCNEYMATGPTYRFGGQGFVFQKGSPIASDVSQAILTLSEAGELRKLENEWFNSSISCPESTSGLDSERLKIDSFLGLFIISVAISTISFLLFVAKLLRNKVREFETYSSTNVISNDSRWRKTIRLILIVLRLHSQGNVFPSRDELNSRRWELVSPSEIPGHMGIVPRPTEIEIPVRTELDQRG